MISHGLRNLGYRKRVRSRGGERATSMGTVVVKRFRLVAVEQYFRRLKLWASRRSLDCRLVKQFNRVGKLTSSSKVASDPIRITARFREANLRKR